MSPLEIQALRRLALSISVLDEFDIAPATDGAVLPGLPEVHVPWEECALAIADAAPESLIARRRLSRWLRARRLLADRSLAELAEIARAVGLPVGHALHPGEGWTQLRVTGGALDLGIGFLGLGVDPDEVVIVPQGALDASGIDARPWWSDALSYVEDMGAMAAVRWRRAPNEPIRPMGDCDVVTLLGSIVFRGAVAASAGGMRAAAVPMRNRGWLELSRIDPAFVRAAADITDAENRGFERPVLVTAEELTLAGNGAFPAEIVLRDPAVESAWLRDVLYHG
jgi:hypothetical protein